MDELGRLRELITRHGGEGGTPTSLPGVSVLCSRTTTKRLGDITEPTLAVIAQGAKETALNGRIFGYGAGQFVITSLELPVVGHIVQATADEPFLAFVLRLRPSKIAALLLETAPPRWHTAASVRFFGGWSPARRARLCGRSGWPTAGSPTLAMRSVISDPTTTRPCVSTSSRGSRP